MNDEEEINFPLLSNLPPLLLEIRCQNSINFHFLLLNNTMFTQNNVSLPLPVMGNNQDWFMNSSSSVLGINDHAFYNSQQSAPPQQQFLGDSSSSLTMALATEMEKQKLETDWLLQLETQRMRTIMQEESRQKAILLKNYESRLMSLLYKKEEDLVMARNKTVKLQEHIMQAEVEAKGWQKKAVENEAMILDLNKKLDLAINEGYGIQDAESFCDSSVAGKGKGRKIQPCMFCDVGEKSIVFLPCRHLGCCKDCEILLGFCPICNSEKKASIEICME